MPRLTPCNLNACFRRALSTSSPFPLPPGLQEWSEIGGIVIPLVSSYSYCKNSVPSRLDEHMVSSARTFLALLMAEVPSICQSSSGSWEICCSIKEVIVNVSLPGKSLDCRTGAKASTHSQDHWIWVISVFWSVKKATCRLVYLIIETSAFRELSTIRS